MEFRIISSTNHPTKLAYERGLERGQGDAQAGYYNESPLSGEWAGESIPELLGDLIVRFEDDSDNLEELCDLYEQGYNKAFEEA